MHKIISLKKQGRIHGFPSHVRVGRGSDRECHWGISAGAVNSKRQKIITSSKNRNKSSKDRTWSAVPDALLDVIS